MREINIVVRCDMCIAQGNHEEARVHETQAISVKLTMANQGAEGIREMDLCPECAADLINMSRQDHEVKAKPKAKKGESPWIYTKDYGFNSSNQPSWMCNYCPAAYESEQGVKQHLSRTHKDQLPA